MLKQKEESIDATFTTYTYDNTPAISTRVLVKKFPHLRFFLRKKSVLRELRGDHGLGAEVNKAVQRLYETQRRGTVYTHLSSKARGNMNAHKVQDKTI